MSLILFRISPGPLSGGRGGDLCVRGGGGGGWGRRERRRILGDDGNHVVDHDTGHADLGGGGRGEEEGTLKIDETKYFQTFNYNIHFRKRLWQLTRVYCHFWKC